MSPHSTERTAWGSSKWMWLLLALCLIAWRVNSRVEQFHPASVASAGELGQVSFFDANERNTAACDATRVQSRWCAEEADGLFPVALTEPPPRPARQEWERRTVLPPVYVDAVSLFSNPPPTHA